MLPSAGATWSAPHRAMRTKSPINPRKKADTDLKKPTRRARIDRKKADTLQKKYDCIGTLKRYNGITMGALPLRLFETALKPANSTPSNKGSRLKRMSYARIPSPQSFPNDRSVSCPLVFETIQLSQAGVRPNAPPQQWALAPAVGV